MRLDWRDALTVAIGERRLVFAAYALRDVDQVHVVLEFDNVAGLTTASLCDLLGLLADEVLTGAANTVSGVDVQVADLRGQLAAATARAESAEAHLAMARAGAVYGD